MKINDLTKNMRLVEKATKNSNKFDLVFNHNKKDKSYTLASFSKAGEAFVRKHGYVKADETMKDSLKGWDNDLLDLMQHKANKENIVIGY